MNEIIKKYRQRRDARVKNHCDADSGDFDWITVKGSHVPLEGGKSAGGWSKGRDFSKAVSKKGFKSYGESNVKHAMEKKARRERNGKPAPDTNSNSVGKNWSGSNYGKVKMPSKKSETGVIDFTKDKDRRTTDPIGKHSLEVLREAEERANRGGLPNGTKIVSNPKEKTEKPRSFTPKLKPEGEVKWITPDQHELIRGANTDIDHTALTKKYSDMCTKLRNGGGDKDSWKEYRDTLKDVPVGTVVEETYNRGEVSQFVKTGEDKWTRMPSRPGGESMTKDSKTMSMSLAGRDLPIDISFKKAENSLTPKELADKYYDATAGQIDQWLGRSSAKVQGKASAPQIDLTKIKDADTFQKSLKSMKEQYGSEYSPAKGETKEQHKKRMQVASQLKDYMNQYSDLEQQDGYHDAEFRAVKDKIQKTIDGLPEGATLVTYPNARDNDTCEVFKKEKGKLTYSGMRSHKGEAYKQESSKRAMDVLIDNMRDITENRMIVKF